MCGLQTLMATFLHLVGPSVLSLSFQALRQCCFCSLCTTACGTGASTAKGHNTATHSAAVPAASASIATATGASTGSSIAVAMVLALSASTSGRDRLGTRKISACLSSAALPACKLYRVRFRVVFVSGLCGGVHIFVTATACNERRYALLNGEAVTVSEPISGG